MLVQIATAAGSALLTFAAVHAVALIIRRHWRRYQVRRMLRDVQYHQLIEEQRRRATRAHGSQPRDEVRARD